MGNINEKIVLIGGGGGVYRIAKFLKDIRSKITTIQTVFDHGGNSRVFRDERGSLPPGDLRQAVLALAPDDLDISLRELLSFRFPKIGNDAFLDGTTVGNVLIDALTQIKGSLPAAINALCQICRVKGTVLPVSLDDAELCSELSDGTIIRGEDKIDTRDINDDRTIVRVFLEPEAHIYVPAHDAIVGGEKITLCSGDTYSSLTPNLLVDGMKHALMETEAKIILVVNLMTKKAETHNFSVLDFARVVYEHIGRKIDYVVYNNAKISDAVLKKYEEKEKSYPVLYTKDDSSIATTWLPIPLVHEVVESGDIIVRHHRRIANVIANL